MYIKEGTIGEKLNGEKIKAKTTSPGLIEKRKGEKVLIFFGGGQEIWYHESDVVYPDPEGEPAGFLVPWVK